MTRPGDRLRSLAARVCSAETMTRLIDPVIADLQAEHGEALRDRRRWRARWIRIAGGVAFAKAIGLHAITRTIQPRPTDGSPDAAVDKALACGMAAGGLVTALLVAVPLNGLTAPHVQSLWFVLYLIPQALPIGIAIGVPFGILCGVGGCMVTRSIRRGVAILAGVATAVAFVTVMWGMPVANQRWRMLVYDEGRQGYPGADVRGGLLEKGANELSLSELTTRIEALRRAGTPDAARPFTRSLHMRWVVSVAPLLLAVFALGVCSVLPSAKRSVTVGLAAIFAYVAFYSFINPAAHWSGTGLRSPGVLTWIPNVVVALAGVAMLTRGRRPRPG